MFWQLLIVSLGLTATSVVLLAYLDRVINGNYVQRDSADAVAALVAGCGLTLAASVVANLLMLPEFEGSRNQFEARHYNLWVLQQRQMHSERRQEQMLSQGITERNADEFVRQKDASVQFAREKAGLLREYNNKVLLLQNPFWRTRYVAEEHSHLRLLPGRIPKPAKEAMK